MNSIIKPICKVYNWTRTAIECYGIGCDCSKCRLTDGLETVNKNNCCMKAAVLKLVKKYGVPKEDLEDPLQNAAG